MTTDTVDDDADSELDRLRNDNIDLRASALLWKALYERAVTRANDLERRLTSLPAQPGTEPATSEISVDAESTTADATPAVNSDSS